MVAARVEVGAHHAVAGQVAEVFSEFVDVKERHPITPTSQHEVGPKINPLGLLRPALPVPQAFLSILFGVVAERGESDHEIRVQLALDGRWSVHTISIYDEELVGMHLRHLFGNGVPEGHY